MFFNGTGNPMGSLGPAAPQGQSPSRPQFMGRLGMGGTSIPTPNPATRAGRVAVAGMMANQGQQMQRPVHGQRFMFGDGSVGAGGANLQGQQAQFQQVQQQNFDRANGGVRPGEMPQQNAVQAAGYDDEQRRRMAAAMGNNGNSALAGYMM